MRENGDVTAIFIMLRCLWLVSDCVAWSVLVEPPDPRDTKSKLSGRQIFCAKSLRTECVNRFCDIYLPKVHKSLSRHICAKSV